MFETGIVIFLSLAFVFIKLKRRTMLRLLRYDMAIDLAVTVVALAIHWGTFSGVMAATFAGLLCAPLSRPPAATAWHGFAFMIGVVRGVTAGAGHKILCHCAFDAALDKAFDRRQQLDLFAIDQRNRMAGSACTTGAADAVHIVFCNAG